MAHASVTGNFQSSSWRGLCWLYSQTPAVLHFDAMSGMLRELITCSESQGVCSDGLITETRGHKVYYALFSKIRHTRCAPLFANDCHSDLGATVDWW